MKRRIIRIDEALCNGCGACAGACHEGAIGMVSGKLIPWQVATLSTDGRILD